MSFFICPASQRLSQRLFQQHHSSFQGDASITALSDGSSSIRKTSSRPQVSQEAAAQCINQGAGCVLKRPFKAGRPMQTIFLIHRDHLLTLLLSRTTQSLNTVHDFFTAWE